MKKNFFIFFEKNFKNVKKQMKKNGGKAKLRFFVFIFKVKVFFMISLRSVMQFVYSRSRKLLILRLYFAVQL